MNPSADRRNERRRLKRRWRVLVVAWLTGAVLLLLFLRGFYRSELYHLTGDAAWMWVSDEVHEPHPTAGLFVTTVELAERPGRATAKVCADPSYVLWINGYPAMAGRNRPEFSLDVVPVTDLLRAGSNVLAIEARSPTSVGAVLFALDLHPTHTGALRGDPRGRNVLVSGRLWRVHSRWSREMLETGGSGGKRPWVWGRPPDHPWTYPVPRLHERPLIQAVSGNRRAVSSQRRGPGRWLYRVPDDFHGLVTISRPPDGWPRDLTIVARGAGDVLFRMPVITFPEQETWLFPDTWDAERLILLNAPTPPEVHVEPTRPTVIR